MKMKKTLTVIMVLLTIILFTSCADNKTIDGVTYRPYGLLNEETQKNDLIQYEVSTGALISGIIFCEVIVPPIYVFGYHLWEPIGKKSDYTGSKSMNGVVK